MSVFAHPGLTHTGGIARSGLRYWLVVALAVHGVLLALPGGHSGAPTAVQTLIVSFGEPAAQRAVAAAEPRTHRRAPLTPALSVPIAAVVAPAPAVAQPAEVAPIASVLADTGASAEPLPNASSAAPSPSAVPTVPEGALLLADMLRDAIERHKRYPRLAQTRAWEGTASIRFELQRDGRLAALTLARSSGHAVLDRAALAAVNGIAPFTRAAEYLAEAQPFTIDIIFKLSGD